MPNPLSVIERPHQRSHVSQRLISDIRSAYRWLAQDGRNPPLLAEVVEKVEGAYPAVVAAALDELGLRYVLTRGSADRRASYGVELHALDYEWYFRPETIQFLAERLPPLANVLFIGTPTVAAARARTGQFIRLIDSNPLVTRRFPDLNLANTHIARVENVRRTFDEPDFILLDAPWNFRDVMTWLRIGHAHARPGTTIFTSLFPERTRPTAPSERAQVQALAAQIGKTTLDRSALHYETPLFEEEALRAYGLRDVGDWRTGDLLTVNVKNYESVWQRVRRISASNRPRRDEHWRTFVIREQVVKLRKRRTHQSGLVLQPIPGCPDNLLPSVSARDPRRRRVGLWTSWNRVASVRSPHRVARVLDALERGGSFLASLDTAAAEGAPLDEASAMLLHAILTPTNDS